MAAWFMSAGHGDTFGRPGMSSFDPNVVKSISKHRLPSGTILKAVQIRVLSREVTPEIHYIYIYQLRSVTDVDAIICKRTVRVF